LSDHAPVSLFYKDIQSNKHSTKWRLHPKWLQKSDFIRFIDEHIDVYFSVNTNQTSASMRWEAFKAYIRGQMISFTSSKSYIQLYIQAENEGIGLQNQRIRKGGHQR